MMNIYKNIDELVGKTPLMEISNIIKEENLQANVFAKLECFNPTGSAKDRPALQMILKAEEDGILKENSVIIEPTSGNTGIGLAAIGASKGYKVIIVMPDTMSQERILLMKAYGAEVVLTDGKKGMQGSIEEAQRLSEKYENSFIPSQFDNPQNPEAHYKTTGPEIWSDTEGKVNILVAGIGTGGTLSGTGKYLKEQNADIKVVGVEPLSSPLLTKGVAGAHGIQGIGANFIPENLDREIYDEIIDVSNEDAFKYARKMAQKEGIAVGISSGAALFGAIELAKRPENKGKNIVVVLTDTGERYLSTELYK
ncbi:MAG: cysteine synthase A [Ruminococcaceae bacterium]|nr:cysteine synthase A [Oscillospiraceae bacterium]